MKLKIPETIDNALKGFGFRAIKTEQNDDGIEKLKKLTEVLSGEESWELDITQLFFTSTKEV